MGADNWEAPMEERNKKIVDRLVKRGMPEAEEARAD